MNAASLNALLNSPQPPLLIHVNTEEHYAARRIAGARNACVYEMAFVDHVAELAPDKATPIVVYGEGAPSLDSEEAANRLKESGYTAVADFRGGLREWEKAGLPIVSEAPLPTTALVSGAFRVDTEGSIIRWTGRNFFNHHSGFLKLAGGGIELKNGALLQAGFTVDMNSIVCEDIPDPGYNAILIRHLRTADFFDVEQHPTASFTAEKVEQIQACTEGEPNYQITGPFTLRGISREISFPAVIAAADSDHITAQAQIEIDRTLWGSRYGSGKFFAFLGKHVVNDHIHLHLKIHAVRV
jgi:polyisoprenoid-binding protein YceI